MWTAVSCAIALFAAPQGPEQLGSDPATTAERPIAALRGGLEVTRADYLAWLAANTGGARLEEMLRDLALELDCAALEGEPVPDDLAAALADPGQIAARRLDRRIVEQHGGVRAAWIDDLAARGWTPAEALVAEQILVLRDARIARLVRRDRTISRADLERAFSERCGPDGVLVRAAQVLVSFADVRRRLETGRRGPPLDDAAVRAAAQTAAAQLAATARANGGLEGLGPVAVPDGFERFAGDAFASALRELPPGQVSEPVESRFGFHLLEVAERTVTRFEDVERSIRDALQTAPPSLAEQRALWERLDAQHGIREALRRRADR